MRLSRRASRIVLPVLLLWVLTGCGGGPSQRNEMTEKLLVVASIPPLRDFARRVGGSRVETDVILPPGSSPHTFEPKPDQLARLDKAQVLILNGRGLEPWVADLVDAVRSPDLLVVETAKGLDLIQEGSGRDRGSGNPHVWLDPINAIHQVDRIRDALVEIDTNGRETYQRNAAEFIAELHRLDQEIRETVATFEGKEFVSQHAAWTYFAKRYGLVEAGVVETTPGREPSPREIANIVRTVRETGVKAVFAEPQLPQKAARVIAAESGAKVLLLDPLGGDGSDYLELMRRNIETLKDGLGKRSD